MPIKQTMKCFCCGQEFSQNDFYNSNSFQYQGTGKIPYCSNCVNTMYEKYLEDFKDLSCKEPKKRAIQRLCMVLDLYYDDKIFDNAMGEYEKRMSDADVKTKYSFPLYYLKHVKLKQHQKKNYYTTISEEYAKLSDEKLPMGGISLDEVEAEKIASKAAKFFGSGFTNEEYVYLQEQYDDWVTRHECQTKAQEEIFKQICFTQLNLLRAINKKEDTKDLNATFLKQLEAAKLQPKQNSGDVVSDSQTFGTLIDKWENTRPLPEVDEELKDVDNIALYVDTFFKGHLAKMMGLKNGLSNMYDDYMKQYTVTKPEYDDDEGGEMLFDSIFGNKLSDSEGD